MARKVENLGCAAMIVYLVAAIWCGWSFCRVCFFASVGLGAVYGALRYLCLKEDEPRWHSLRVAVAEATALGCLGVAIGIFAKWTESLF